MALTSVSIARHQPILRQNTCILQPQRQYGAGRTPPPNNPPPNMSAANFVVITKTERGACLMEQLLPQCWSTNSVPHAFFLRVAIGCRLSLKIDQNLSPSWAGGLSMAMIWYGENSRYGIWRIFIQICDTHRSPFLRCCLLQVNTVS